MSATPWYAWYPSDYRAKTSHLSFLQDSAYRKLLDAYYDRGGLLYLIGVAYSQLHRITGAQTDDEKIAVDSVVIEFFYIKDNKLCHIRADEEIARRALIKVRLSNAGKRGAAIAGRGRPKEIDRPPLGKVTVTVTDKSNTLAPSGAFSLFWAAYPKKRSRGSAEKAWKRCANGNIAEIMAGLETSKSSNDWRKDNGKFIPYPASWLNARGWEDEQTAIENEPRRLVI